MIRSPRILLGLAAALVLPGAPARAQYYYPAGYGYGGYGFGGWGQTPQGSIAAGMGAFAAGAGQYNYETSAARSVNADTVMKWNTYLWASQNNINRAREARLAEQGSRNKAAFEAIRKRVRENPNQVDIDRGDALNAILDQLTYPKFLEGSGLARATTEIDAKEIKNLPFRYTPAAVVVTIDRYQNDIPPLLKSDAVKAEREAFKEALQGPLAQIKAGEEVAPADADRVRQTGRALFQKVETGLPKATVAERKAALDYLKSLKAFLKMLTNPDIAHALRELERVDSAPVGSLIAFMHTYSLRFGPATTPAQTAANRKIYPILAAERDRLLGRSADTQAEEISPEPPPIPAEIFHGIADEHLNDAGKGN